MEIHYPINVVEKILKSCKNETSGFVCSQMCPYSKMKDCLEVLHDDALYYIKTFQEKQIQPINTK